MDKKPACVWYAGLDKAGALQFDVRVDLPVSSSQACAESLHHKREVPADWGAHCAELWLVQLTFLPTSALGRMSREESLPIHRAEMPAEMRGGVMMHDQAIKHRVCLSPAGAAIFLALQFLGRRVRKIPLLSPCRRA